jgi:hypothetical protein
MSLPFWNMSTSPRDFASYLSPDHNLGGGRLGDGRRWVQVGEWRLVNGVDVSGGQEKWELQGRRLLKDESNSGICKVRFKLSLQAHVIMIDLSSQPTPPATHHLI